MEEEGRYRLLKHMAKSARTSKMALTEPFLAFSVPQSFKVLEENCFNHELH